jgi:hypothetical protein
MFTIDPKEIKTGVLHSYMLAAIAPRPIAFASTIDNGRQYESCAVQFFQCLWE